MQIQRQTVSRQTLRQTGRQVIRQPDNSNNSKVQHERKEQSGRQIDFHTQGQGLNQWMYTLVCVCRGGVFLIIIIIIVINIISFHIRSIIININIIIINIIINIIIFIIIIIIIIIKNNFFFLTPSPGNFSYKLDLSQNQVNYSWRCVALSVLIPSLNVACVRGTTLYSSNQENFQSFYPLAFVYTLTLIF